MKRVYFGLGVIVLAAVAAYFVRPAIMAQDRPAEGERPFTAEFVTVVKKSNCGSSMDLEKVKLIKLDGRSFLVGTGADTPDNWQKGKSVYVALDDVSEVTTFGCETISPLPVFSIAVSSRSSSTLSVMNAMPIPEVLFTVPMSTNGELVPVLPGVPIVLDEPLTPEAFQLPLFCTEPPQRTPRLLS